MVGWLTERRVIQRAADEALMTPRPPPGGLRHEQTQPEDRDFPPGFRPGRLDNQNVTLLSDVSAMAGGYRNPPWYLSKRLVAASAVTVIVALAVWGIVGVLRGPAGGGDETPAVSPPTGQTLPVIAPVEGRTGQPIEVAPPPPPPRPTAEQLLPRAAQRIRSP